MNEQRNDERETGQNPNVHEQAEPVAEPRNDDTNEYADDRATVVQPDGEPVPVADDADGREDA